MENMNQNTTVPVKKEWTAPACTVLSVNNDTLGSSNPGDDGTPTNTLS